MNSANKSVFYKHINMHKDALYKLFQLNSFWIEKLFPPTNSEIKIVNHKAKVIVQWGEHLPRMRQNWFDP